MLNVITMVGRLTRDPELRRSANERSIGNFTIACDNGKSSDGQRQTIFMDCTVFGPQADTLVKYFRKGSLIGVYGRLVSRKYINRQNVEVVAYSINADRIEFVEPASKNPATAGFTPDMPIGDGPTSQVNPATEKQNVEGIDVTDDDLPF